MPGDLFVANEIIRQLGGNRFKAMTGAKNFIGRPNALSFQLPSRPGYTRQGINGVRIVLDASDTYTVTFLKSRGSVAPKVISEHGDIYAEDLQRLFSEATGLATHL